MSTRAWWRPSLGSAERRGAWRHFFKLTSAYFVSNQWPVAWAMLLTMIGQRFAFSYIVVLSARWEKALFDAIGARQADQMLPLVFQFLLIALGTTAFGLIATYVQPMLGMRWRAWLTADYQERWLRDERYLAIERADMLDNADQRITEDMTLFTQQLLGLVLGFLGTVSSIWLFGGLLLEASDPIAFSAFGHAVSIPGDMIVYAVLYALVGSVLIAVVGKRFIWLSQLQQKLEANYRFRLINVRRNAEQIAFARAAASEWRMLNADFRLLYGNFRKTQFASVWIGLTSGLYGSVQTVLPIFLVLPKYFAGRVSIGDIMQTRQGFSAFNMSLSWFIQSYQTIALVIAATNRIRALDEAILTPPPQGIAVTHDARGGIVLGDVRLDRPDGTALAGIGDWRIARGERWCLTGASGAGKSTLLRALAGIWPYGTGTVALPADGLVMFLPQRGYLPIGTIKEALAFPGTADAYDDDRCRAVLERFGLGQWIASLEEHARWSERLSPGEQQRMALARVVLQRPEYLFLDEATSALDPENADHAFTTLRAELPDLTLVSVVHDPALERFHDRKLVIDQGIARLCAPATT